MYIPSYQMHNVLNTYTKQVRQNRLSEEKVSKDRAAVAEISSSTLGKRKSILEKITADIIDRISTLRSWKKGEQKNTCRLYNEGDDSLKSENNLESRFVFNTINKNNIKSLDTFSTENSNFLFNCPEKF